MGFSEKMLKYLKMITVEPVVLILFIGVSFGMLTNLIGGYYKTCELFFGPEIGTDCTHLADNHDSEISVQKTYTEWQTWYLIASLAPGIPVTIMIGEYMSVAQPGRGGNLSFWDSIKPLV